MKHSKANAMQHLNHRFILSTILLFACLACEKETVELEPVTGDLTLLGIQVPVTKHHSDYADYTISYTSDNRVTNVKGDRLYINRNPLEFVVKSADGSISHFYGNFKFNSAGCATYYERLTSDRRPVRIYTMTYDADNYLITIKEKPYSGNDEMKTVVTRGIGKRIDRIDSYYKGELSEYTTFSYSGNIENTAGIFVPRIVSNEPFITYTGLLGRPAGVLPSTCRTTSYTYQGDTQMYAKYHYSTLFGNHFNRVEEEWSWPSINETWTMIETFAYKESVLNKPGIK